MNCLAIGDVFIPTKYFDCVLKANPLFEKYESYAFCEDLGRKEARELVRKMETMGYSYHSVPQEVYQMIEDKDVLFLHMFPIPGELIHRAKNLRYILTARGGLEHIDLKTAQARGVHIINCPSHNALAVAEYTIGLMMCEMRNIARSDCALIKGVWRENYDNSTKIPELNDSTVGIIGFGTIGRLVAERLKAFGSRVIVSDPYVPKEKIEELGYQAVSLDSLLKQADVITLHGRIPAGAKPIIGKEELQKMKESAYLINTARSSLVDMPALTEALQRKKIMGAAIDVFPQEPISEDYPLLHLDNVTVSNHRGGDTLNSYIKAPTILVKYFEEVLSMGHTNCMIC